MVINHGALVGTFTTACVASLHRLLDKWLRKIPRYFSAQQIVGREVFRKITGGITLLTLVPWTLGALKSKNVAAISLKNERQARTRIAPESTPCTLLPQTYLLSPIDKSLFMVNRLTAA